MTTTKILKIIENLVNTKYDLNSTIVFLKNITSKKFGAYKDFILECYLVDKKTASNSILFTINRSENITVDKEDKMWEIIEYEALAKVFDYFKIECTKDEI